ncbi:hypothetical protein [Metallosphaera hakonensis]|uniref:hypothetical protein n=1 Tax=Metallosphaera hakonensis TaxID=79601 RepID=UPI0020933827|nr:hypothetical protein [Metallosphaera hakonensis]
MVVDTYAMLSMGFGELTKNAEEVMLRIRRRELEGLVPSTVAFEFTVHWLRGRIPSLTSINEVRTSYNLTLRS